MTFRNEGEISHSEIREKLIEMIVSRLGMLLVKSRHGPQGTATQSPSRLTSVASWYLTKAPENHGRENTVFEELDNHMQKILRSSLKP